MTGREMLECAARAAWYKLDGLASKHVAQGVGLDDMLRINDQGGHSVWNPLTDDGDALRLAVKLRISLIHEQEYMGGPVLETLEATSPRISLDGGRHVSTECLNDLNCDEFVATRRAIVRAAAEIGKAMQ